MVMQAARGQADRDWVANAIRLIEADFNRSADTHLLRLALPAMPQIAIYLKDESTHPTGSLKHRLARSLILYALCNGWIGPDTVLVEASSGSTAVSEAYFARMLGLRFMAVMPQNTAAEKLEAIRHYGGECHFVSSQRQVTERAAELAAETGGHFVDQFTYAERATDWRGNNNIAESIFAQMANEDHPVPTWIVAGAGTGGTTATIGRYIRYRRLTTLLCLADPERSVFHRAVTGSLGSGEDGPASCIEGIGRLQLEPSFNPRLIDRVGVVPDHASIGAARAISRWTGRACGGSTGTNLIATIALARAMVDAGQTGSIVTLICDSGQRYQSTYFDETWLAAHGGAWREVEKAVTDFLTAGLWSGIGSVTLAEAAPVYDR